MRAGGSKKQVRRTSTGRIRKLDLNLRSNSFILCHKRDSSLKNDYRISFWNYWVNYSFNTNISFSDPWCDWSTCTPSLQPILSRTTMWLCLSWALVKSQWSTQPVCLPSAGQEIPPSLHCWLRRGPAKCVRHLSAFTSWPLWWLHNCLADILCVCKHDISWLLVECIASWPSVELSELECHLNNFPKASF